jgi:hypothetical protein
LSVLVHTVTWASALKVFLLVGPPSWSCNGCNHVTHLKPYEYTAFHSLLAVPRRLVRLARRHLRQFCLAVILPRKSYGAVVVSCLCPVVRWHASMEIVVPSKAFGSTVWNENNEQIRLEPTHLVNKVVGGLEKPLVLLGATRLLDVGGDVDVPLVLVEHGLEALHVRGRPIAPQVVQHQLGVHVHLPGAAAVQAVGVLFGP